MHLFYYCEGDPDVLAADYAPGPTTCLPQDRDVQPDAVVMLRTGTKQYRFLDRRPEEAPRRSQQADDPRFRFITVNELESSWLRIKNWQEVLAACHRCETSSISRYKLSVLEILLGNTPHTVSSLIESLAAPPALGLGAITQLLRERRVFADLDRERWTWTTRVVPGEAE